jgi:hypothetical protein
VQRRQSWGPPSAATPQAPCSSSSSTQHEALALNIFCLAQAFASCATSCDYRSLRC